MYFQTKVIFVGDIIMGIKEELSEQVLEAGSLLDVQ